MQNIKKKPTYQVITKGRKKTLTRETKTKGNKAVKRDRKQVSQQKWEQDYQKRKKKRKK